MAGDAPFVINDSASGTAAAFGFTDKGLQIAVRNLHATQTLTVCVSTSTASAAAAKTKAGLAPKVAVIGADDNFTIPPIGQREIVFKSKKSVYAAISVIASGAASPFTAEFTPWVD